MATMMPINYTLRKYIEGYNFPKSQEKKKYSIDDIEIFAKDEERETLIRNLRINSHDIRTEFGIEKYIRLIIKKKY